MPASLGPWAKGPASLRPGPRGWPHWPPGPFNEKYEFDTKWGHGQITEQSWTSHCHEIHATKL